MRRRLGDVPGWLLAVMGVIGGIIAQMVIRTW